MIFNGIDFSVWMLCDPQRPLLPVIQVPSQSIPGRNGRLVSPGSMTLDSVEIPVVCYLRPEKSWPREQARYELEDLKRLLVSMLLVRREADLILDGDPSRYYKGILQGADGIERLGAGEKMTLNFLCDPVAYGHEHTVEFTSGNGKLNIHGTYETYPEFRITAHGSVPYIQITNTDTADFIRVNGSFSSGTKLTVDMEGKQAMMNGSNVAVTLQSSYFPLQPGNNSINLSSGNAVMRYKERWL